MHSDREMVMLRILAETQEKRGFVSCRSVQCAPTCPGWQPQTGEPPCSWQRALANAEADNAAERECAEAAAHEMREKEMRDVNTD